MCPIFPIFPIFAHDPAEKSEKNENFKNLFPTDFLFWFWLELGQKLGKIGQNSKSYQNFRVSKGHIFPFISYVIREKSRVVASRQLP